MITASEISERLAHQAEAVAQRLLPGGHRDGREWVAGDVHGGEGKSLKVVLTGDKVGIWKDFASDDSGDLLDLWAASKGISIGEALREARDYLGVVAPAFTGSRHREYTKPSKPKATRPKGNVMAYLHGRGLTDAAISTYRVAANEADDELIFPYLRDGEFINAKYLKIDRPGGKKQIRQEKDAEPCLFGWQAIPDRARSVVICEGEIDAISWWQMGYPALSVWSGAGNLQWLETEWDRLAQFDCINVAFDNDAAGIAGATALIDRLGRVRCRMVSTPFKDANECLARGFDSDCFRELIEGAQSLDPHGLHSATYYKDAVMARFFPPAGSRTGWETPFEKLSLRGVMFHPAELVVINGINGHGKTKFTTQLALSLMRQGAKCCIASMEVKTDALLHSATIQACAMRQPAAHLVEYVQEEWNGKLWMFDVLGTTKADYLLDVFRYVRSRYGVTCFIIDSLAKCGLAEDDYNGQKRFVEALCDFKNDVDAIVFLVTHSRKLEAEARVVDKMDIKGTGAIADLADVVTTLWRNKAKELSPDDRIDEPDARWYWQKNRNGDYEGQCQLWFDPPSYQFLPTAESKPKPYVSWVRAADVQGE